MDGSCIEAQSQHIQGGGGGGDEPKTYTFFSDVMQHPEVNRLGNAVKDAIMNGMSNIMNCIGQWKKYRILWRLQRVQCTCILIIVLLCTYTVYINNSVIAYIQCILRCRMMVLLHVHV